MDLKEKHLVGPALLLCGCCGVSLLGSPHLGFLGDLQLRVFSECEAGSSEVCREYSEDPSLEVGIARLG